MGTSWTVHSTCSWFTRVADLLTGCFKNKRWHKGRSDKACLHPRELTVHLARQNATFSGIDHALLLSFLSGHYRFESEEFTSDL
jgi:hypothetical protein